MTEVETINRVAEILGSSGSAVVSEYTVWFAVASIIWIAVGIFLCGIALRWKPSEHVFEVPVALGIKAAMFFVGLLFIGCNVPDLAAPKAIAIHQLVKDVRG